LHAAGIFCYDNKKMTITTRSLKQVAAAAGVSTMTVSRVMRNSPLVGEKTRARVLAVAKKMDYQPNPIASRLMAVVRKGKGRKNTTAIALVRDRRGRPSADGDIHRYVNQEDVRHRAEMHGYAVDEFLLGEGGLTVTRLQSILTARSIEGVLFSLETLRNEVEGFDFSRYASATFGYGLQAPALHRASTNMMQGLCSAFLRLEKLGYERIGLAITPWVNDRSDQTYSGAMLNYQANHPRRQQVPPLIFRSNNLVENKRAFCHWARLHRPDVVISFDKQVPDWIRKTLGRRIPEDVGFVVHDWTERAAGYSGICHNRNHVVMAAVDMVTTQLHHSEIGIPEVPHQVLIPPTWVEGESCRASITIG